MPEAWQCPVWHPGDCDGTPACPPRCPRFVADDGTAVTVYAPDDGRLVGVDDAGATLASATVADGHATIERCGDAPTVAAVEVARQAIARAHERGDGRLTLEADPAVLEAVRPSVAPAVSDHDRDSLTLDPRHEAASALTLAPAAGTAVEPAARLDGLVDPETVAVVGATDRPGSIGRVLLEQLQAFDGTVVPVTDRHDEVLGLPAVDDIADTSADLAVIALPPAAVVEAVDAAIAAGVEAVAILSAGFGEAGETERTDALLDRLAAVDVAAIGPNALGVLSTRGDLNASFAPQLPAAGGLSVVSHSGAMITAILAWADAAGIGVRDVVSLGNRIDVTAAELVRYWGRDPHTDVIAAYLEDLPDGRAFVEAARDVTPTTPIVALKAGRTDAGAAAATSHTGAVAGEDAGYAAAFDAANVLRARGQDELFTLVGACTRLPVPASPSVAVVTNAGGPGVVAADAVVEAGLEMATLAPETHERLGQLLPAAATGSNPVDVLGDADVPRFEAALSAVAADPTVGAALVTTTPHPLVPIDELTAAVDDVAARHGLPVVLALPGDAAQAQAAGTDATAVVTTSDAHRGADTLAALYRYGRRRRRPRAGLDPIDADDARVASRLASAEEAGRSTLGVEALGILSAYGVETAETRLVDAPGAVPDAVAAVGGEAVLKAVAPGLAHKTDVGGVVTDVTAADAHEAADHLEAAMAANAPETPLEAIAVQAAVDGGVEVLVGVTTHERFGPVVTVGLGGVLVEQLGDVAHGLAPVSRHTARELVESLAGAELILEGPRGEAAPSVDALADAIARISRLAADHAAIRTLEVNPLLATPTGAVAVDIHLELAA